MKKTPTSAEATAGKQHKNGKPVSRRVKMLVRRHLRELARGFAALDRANDALTKARTNGLKVGDVVDVERINPKTQAPETVPFELIDNRLEMEKKGRIYRPARVPLFELKEIPKFKRAGAEAAHTAEVGS